MVVNNNNHVKLKQVTLSENVHKFVELSQRIVVEKSVIEKYEEETTRNTLNRIRSTQEISTQKYNQSGTMTSSSSSSNIVGKLSTSSSVDKLLDIERNKIASSTRLAPSPTTTPTMATPPMMKTSTSAPITGTATSASADGTAATTPTTPSDNKNDGEIMDEESAMHASSNRRQPTELINRKTEESITRTKSSSLSTTMTMQQKKFFSSKLTKSNSNNATTNGGFSEDGAKKNGNDAATDPMRNANNATTTKVCDVLNVNSTITKLPPPEVTMQRPLKPQSEMDFAVPYNIINNYFSVGVVSGWVARGPLNASHSCAVCCLNGELRARGDDFDLMAIAF